MAGRDYRDLIAWQKAMHLVEDVYRVTQLLPDEERYGLISQMRRSSVSVPANIAEGQGRQSDAEFVRFLRIAHGSVRELETLAMVAVRVEQLQPRDVETLLAGAEETGKLIQGLIRAKRTDP